MLFNIALIAGGMATEFLKSLKADSVKVKALAADEAQKLTTSLATIGQMLLDGDVDREEADALMEVQRAATETVFASLEGIGRVAARRATHAGLSGAAAVVDGAIGAPLVATLLGGAPAGGGAG